MTGHRFRVGWVVALLLGHLIVLLALPVAAQEPGPVQGGGSAADAPRLPPGSYTDLIGEPRPSGTGSRLGRVSRWPSQWSSAAGPEVQRARPANCRWRSSTPSSRPAGTPSPNPSTATSTRRSRSSASPCPRSARRGAYLTVSLASPTGANDLRDLGYQIEFAVAVGVEAVPPAQTPTAVPQDEFFDPPTRPEPQPEPASFADLLPVGLMALALGGAGGYELTRRRLRRR